MEQINERHPHKGDWLRDIVFGLNDGLVTTLVFVMAVSEVAPGRLLLVVLGEVLAGGISMALGGYLSARTAKQVLDRRIATERYEIEHEPEEERAELRAIYRNKGFSGPLLHRVVGHLTANQERWHRAMVHDELGVVEDTHINPWLQGMQVGLSFVVGALYPPGSCTGGFRISHSCHYWDPGRCGHRPTLTWRMSLLEGNIVTHKSVNTGFSDTKGVHIS